MAVRKFQRKEKGINMKYMIETNALSKKYGEKYSVKNLNLKVRPGCVYGFLGPNGAGKSTMLKILAGVEEPTEGTVSKSAEVRMGYLPQTMIYKDGNTVRREAEKRLPICSLCAMRWNA